MSIYTFSICAFFAITIFVIILLYCALKLAHSSDRRYDDSYWEIKYIDDNSNSTSGSPLIKE